MDPFVQNKRGCQRCPCGSATAPASFVYPSTRMICCAKWSAPPTTSALFLFKTRQHYMIFLFLTLFKNYF
jgi:hypothetical protein